MPSANCEASMYINVLLTSTVFTNCPILLNILSVRLFVRLDLVCSFNFSASLNQFFSTSFKHHLFEIDREATFFYTSNNQNNYFNTLSLRGPPQLV